MILIYHLCNQCFSITFIISYYIISRIELLQLIVLDNIETRDNWWRQQNQWLRWTQRWLIVSLSSLSLSWSQSLILLLSLSSWILSLYNIAEWTSSINSTIRSSVCVAIIDNDWIKMNSDNEDRDNRDNRIISVFIISVVSIISLSSLSSLSPLSLSLSSLSLSSSQSLSLCLHYLWVHLNLSSTILLIEEVHYAMLYNDRTWYQLRDVERDRDN